MSNEDETATAVAIRRGGTSITRRAREDFDDKQIELIRATVAKDCNTPELYMFLELCAKYDLDPFAREIYAAKMGNKDGQTGNVVMIIGRDGLLAIANRSGEFLGIEGDVVCQNDTFSKKAGEALPTHEYTQTDRGDIVGAWAVAYRMQRQPTYFFAPLAEYKPGPGRKLDYSPWSSQQSAMILKCAESMALRKAFSITGLVGEEEMSRNRAIAENGARQLVSASDSELEWGEDPALALWLQQLVAAANESKASIYRPAKLRAMLQGRTDDEREEFAVVVCDQLAAAGVAVPERPTAEQAEEARVAAEKAAQEAQEAEAAAAAEAEAAEAEEVHDAEVVNGEEDVDTEGYVPSDPEADIPFTEPEVPGQESLDGA